MNIISDSAKPQLEEQPKKKVDNITKYEKARVLPIRATQIAHGSKPKVELPKGMIDPLEIATLEFEKGVLDLVIERNLPSGEKVYVSTKRN